MDYEALKDQWTEVEDRDGIRLSWNTFPSTRMVCQTPFVDFLVTETLSGSVAACGTYRSDLYPSQGKARFPNTSV
jgi:hypothetical protein